MMDYIDLNKSTRGRRMKSFSFPLLMLFSVLLVTGCGGEGNPATPPSEFNTETTDHVLSNSSGNRYFLTAGRITFNSANDFSILPDRNLAAHLNVLRKLEFSPCDSCLTLQDVKHILPNEIEFNLFLFHPYEELQASVFDVRAIIMTGSDFTFPVNNQTMASESGSVRLLNSDGFTDLFNPVHFPPGSQNFPIHEYIPGNLATGGNLDATLNPFIAFKKDLEPPDRRFFGAGNGALEEFKLYYPDFPFEFGYAIDVNWKYFPDVTSSSDFPLTANCPEPYKIETEVGQLEHNSNDSVEILVGVYDHQGIDTIGNVTIEAPHLFSGEIELQDTGQSIGSGRLFSGIFHNENLVGYGDYPLLVRAESTETDPYFGQVDGFNVYSVNARNGWARVWTCSGQTQTTIKDISCDSDGNVYWTGYGYYCNDFDTGIRTNKPEKSGSCLVKYDPDGMFVWARGWGSSSSGRDISTDVLDNIYVAGHFQHDVDLDPGDDEYIVDAGIKCDIYLSKFDTNGNLIWVQTWGNDEGDMEVSDISTDQEGNVVLAGIFDFTIDFDPGPGLAEKTAIGEGDIFLLKLDAGGNYLWANVLEDEGEAGEYLESINSIAADNIGNIYICGVFRGTLDVNGCDGVCILHSNGDQDSFLAKYNSEGELAWACGWGGSEVNQADYTIDIEINNDNEILVCGMYTGTVDFNPGPGIDEAYSFSPKSYLSKFQPDGKYLGVVLWDAYFYVKAMDTYGNGDIVLSGDYGQGDLNPGPGVYQDVNGVVILRLDTNWNFLWGTATGYYGTDAGIDNLCLGISDWGDIYSGGYFKGWVDFDPGPGLYLKSTALGPVRYGYLLKYAPDGQW